MFNKVTSCSFLLITALYTGNTLAADTTNVEVKDSWEFQVTPYLWAVSLKGTAGTSERTTDINISQSDVIDNLDMAFFLDAQAKKGEWGAKFDMAYMDVSSKQSREHSVIDLEMEQTLLSGSIFYQPKEIAGLQLHFGARYADLTNKIKLTLPSTEGDGIQFSPGDDWTEAFVGVRYTYVATPSLSLTAYGDLGGFSGQSDSMYQLVFTANYQINEMASIRGGYRIFDVDYETNNFIYDVKTDGVILGLGFNF